MSVCLRGFGEERGNKVWMFSELTHFSYSLPSFVHSFPLHGKVDRRFSSYFEFPKPD